MSSFFNDLIGAYSCSSDVPSTGGRARYSNPSTSRPSQKSVRPRQDSNVDMLVAVPDKSDPWTAISPSYPVYFINNTTGRIESSSSQGSWACMALSKYVPIKEMQEFMHPNPEHLSGRRGSDSSGDNILREDLNGEYDKDKIKEVYDSMQKLARENKKPLVRKHTRYPRN